MCPIQSHRDTPPGPPKQPRIPPHPGRTNRRTPTETTGGTPLTEGARGTPHRKRHRRYPPTEDTLRHPPTGDTPTGTPDARPINTWLQAEFMPPKKRSHLSGEHLTGDLNGPTLLDKDIKKTPLWQHASGRSTPPRSTISTIFPKVVWCNFLEQFRSFPVTVFPLDSFLIVFFFCRCNFFATQFFPIASFPIVLSPRTPPVLPMGCLHFFPK